MESLYCIRGATTVASDFPNDIDEAVKELMEAIYRENGITDSDIAAVIFSQTHDIRTRNAAAACRKAGFCQKTPLFCVQEADISGGLKLAIRALVMINHQREREQRMVYLRNASSLRPDYNDKEDK